MKRTLRFGRVSADKDGDGRQAACTPAPYRCDRPPGPRAHGDAHLRGRARSDRDRDTGGRRDPQGGAARRPRPSKSGFRLRKGRPRGRRLRVAGQRAGARICSEHRRRPVPGTRVEARRHGRSARHPHPEAGERLRGDRDRRGHLALCRDGCALDRARLDARTGRTRPDDRDGKCAGRHRYTGQGARDRGEARRQGRDDRENREGTQDREDPQDSDDRESATPAARVHGRRRPPRAAERDAAPRPREGASHVARSASAHDARERRALALPERVDRRRREARLVARRRRAHDARRSRPAHAAAVGNRREERGARAARARRGAVEVEMTRFLNVLAVKEEGYSLVELLVVMIILGTVLASLTTVFVSGSKAEVALNQRFQAQQQARLALDRIRADIHCASAAQAQTIGTYTGSLKLAEPNCYAYATTPTVSWCPVP